MEIDQKAQAKQPVEAEVVEHPRRFADLEEEWEELYAESPRATPFQSWAWLYSWWEHYGDGFDLRIITLRADGLLVGVVPLMLKRSRGPRVLLFIGTGMTDYLDLLARRGWEGQVSTAAVGAIRGLRSWHVADLWDARPSAVVWDVLLHWDGPKTHFRLFGCPRIDVKPWDEVLRSVSRNLRKSTKVALKRVKTDGVSERTVGEADAAEAALRLVALHRESWEGREIGPEHATRRFEKHFQSTIQRMAARGYGAVSEWWHDGEVIVSAFQVFGEDSVGGVLHGASQEARERYQVSGLFHWLGVKTALERGMPYFDTGRGEEAYKLRWTSTVVPNHRLILGRNRAIWALYSAYHFARFRFVRYENSEETPAWIKRATRTVSRVKRRGR